MMYVYGFEEAKYEMNYSKEIDKKSGKNNNICNKCKERTYILIS